MLKYLRRRTGVSAPKLSIRPEWPLPWRIASIVLLSAVALALAGWIYDAGRRFAGFHQSESGEQLAELKSRIETLSVELASAQSVADSSAARLRVESTAQERLAGLVKNLEEENARLKSELAVFESLAGNERAAPTLAISRFDIRRELDTGRYRFNLLATKSGNNADRNFKGRLELVVNVEKSGQAGVINLPEPDDVASYQIHFRLFKRIDGQFAIPDGVTVTSVEAKLMEEGQVRATQIARLADLGGK